MLDARPGAVRPRLQPGRELEPVVRPPPAAGPATSPTYDAPAGASGPPTPSTTPPSPRPSRRRPRQARRARAGLPPVADAPAAAGAAPRPADQPLQPHAVGARRSTSGMLPDASSWTARPGCSAPTPSASCRRAGPRPSALLRRAARARRSTTRARAGRGATCGSTSTRSGSTAPACARAPRARRAGAAAGLRELVGDRQLLLRVDRTELSKNIVRGLHAYARAAARRTRSTAAGSCTSRFAYPSRPRPAGVPEYTAGGAAGPREVNEEFAEPGWLPVHLEVKDDYARSLAACRLADVLLVNPRARRHEPGGEGGAGAVRARARAGALSARRAPPTSSAPTRCWSTRTTCRRPPRRCTRRCCTGRRTERRPRCDRLAAPRPRCRRPPGCRRSATRWP